MSFCRKRDAGLLKSRVAGHNDHDLPDLRRGCWNDHRPAKWIRHRLTMLSPPTVYEQPDRDPGRQLFKSG